MRILRKIFSLFLILFLVTGCDKPTEIVSNLEEREANEIVVFLASKGIDAYKSPSAASGVGGGQGSVSGASCGPKNINRCNVHPQPKRASSY